MADQKKIAVGLLVVGGGAALIYFLSRRNGGGGQAPLLDSGAAGQVTTTRAKGVPVSTAPEVTAINMLVRSRKDLGQATSGPARMGDGYVQLFKGGTFAPLATVAAPLGAGKAFVLGEFRSALWNALGGPQGPLGYPISNDRATDAGSVQDFERGSMVWEKQGKSDPWWGNTAVDASGHPLIGQRAAAVDNARVTGSKQLPPWMRQATGARKPPSGSQWTSWAETGLLVINPVVGLASSDSGIGLAKDLGVPGAGLLETAKGFVDSFTGGGFLKF